VSLPEVPRPPRADIASTPVPAIHVAWPPALRRDDERPGTNEIAKSIEPAVRIGRHRSSFGGANHHVTGLTPDGPEVVPSRLVLLHSRLWQDDLHC
jgi:hypothetical protein